MRLAKYLFILLVLVVIITPGAVGKLGLSELHSHLSSGHSDCAFANHCVEVCYDHGQCFQFGDLTIKNYWFFSKISGKILPGELRGKKTPFALSFDSRWIHGPVVLSQGKPSIALFARTGEIFIEDINGSSKTSAFEFSDISGFDGSIYGTIFSDAKKIPIPQKRNPQPLATLQVAPINGTYNVQPKHSVFDSSLNIPSLTGMDKNNEQLFDVKGIHFSGGSQLQTNGLGWNSKFQIAKMQASIPPFQGHLNAFAIESYRRPGTNVTDIEFIVKLDEFQMTPQILPFENFKLEINSLGLNTKALDSASDEAKKLAENTESVNQVALMDYALEVAKAFSNSKFEKNLLVGAQGDTSAWVESHLGIKFHDLENLDLSNMMAIMNAFDLNWKAEVAQPLLSNPKFSAMLPQLKEKNYIHSRENKYMIDLRFKAGTLYLFEQPVAIEEIMALAMSTPQTSSGPMTGSTTLSDDLERQNMGNTFNNDNYPPSLKRQRRQQPIAPSISSKSVENEEFKSQQPPSSQIKPGPDGLIRFKTPEGKFGFTDNPYKVPPGSEIL